MFTRLPVIEGTVIEVRVERLPDGRSPHRTMWLWHSGPQAPDLDVCWRAYLRRFDMEHTFKLMKSQLGWTAARVRHPEQAVRWTWLLIAAYVQLRLARGMAADLRRPWERRPRPGRPLTPYRVRRSFRHLRDQLGTPARLPKTTRPGPGRPPGGKNTPAPRHRLGSELRKTGHTQEGGRQEERLNLKLGDDLRGRGHRARADVVTDEAIAVMAPGIGTRAACAAAGVPQASWYRRHRASPDLPRAAPVPHRTGASRGRWPRRAAAPSWTRCTSDRFADTGPGRGMGDPAGRGHLPGLGVHVLPGAAPGRGEPRAARSGRAPAAVKPELLATGPNQVWSWDITKLHGPAKWTYFYLYVILDIFSRYAVGWMVATRETAALAEKLIVETCTKQGISPGS